MSFFGMRKSASFGRLFFLFLILPFLTACFKNDSSGQGFRITWEPNRESAVNSPGGGYKIYYSKQSGFNPVTDGKVIDVPYKQGEWAPNIAYLATPKEDSGTTYYFRVMAYGRLGTSHFTSDFTDEQSITAP